MKERFPHSRKPLTGMSVVSFGISESNTIRKERKETPPTPPHTHLTVKLQVETEKWPDTHGHHQRVGTRQGGVGYLIGPLGVRTGPECPEDNLRELM